MIPPIRRFVEKKNPKNYKCTKLNKLQPLKMKEEFKIDGSKPSFKCFYKQISKLVKCVSNRTWKTLQPMNQLMQKKDDHGRNSKGGVMSIFVLTLSKHILCKGGSQQGEHLLKIAQPMRKCVSPENPGPITVMFLLPIDGPSRLAVLVRGRIAEGLQLAEEKS